jgi:hypothetical protein
MKELTSAQEEPLFKLVRYQRKSKDNVIFTISWKNGIVDINKTQKGIIEHTPELINLWSNFGYISVREEIISFPGGTDGIKELTFILTKDADDYEEFKRKSKFAQYIIKLWMKMEKSVYSALWGVLGGAVTYFVIKAIEGK